MKMFLGDVPIKKMNVHYFQEDTNDATMVASDLQSGVTAYARGKKITGTGKSFEFAFYGGVKTNLPQYVPTNINVIHIASVNYPIQFAVALNEMEHLDFTTAQVIGHVTIDGTNYEITVQVTNNLLTISCNKTITLQVFYGKDNYL